MTVITPEQPREYSQAELDNCTMEVRKIRGSALRSEPFFGTIGMGLTIKIGNHFLGKEVDTLATDGRHIYVNPDYFLSKTLGKRKTTVLHEICHVALGHHLRRCGRDFELWNVATDHAVNILLHDSGYEIDEHWHCDLKYRGWSAERIYADIVPKNPPPPPPPPPPGTDPPPPGTEPPPPGTEPPPPGGSEPPAGEEEKPREKKKVGEVWDATNEDGSNKNEKEIEKSLKDLAKDVQNARNVERTAGTSPHAGMERAMDAVVTPETSWQTLLDSFWSDIGEKSGQTWRKFNRRAMMMGLWMPDNEHRSINHIVFGFDISYSVGRNEQAAFIDKIEQLRESIPCKLITIIPFNHVVQQDQIVEVEQYDDLPKKLKVGGGTRFSPVFNYVRRMDKVPDAMIMFTDLGSSEYGTAPDCPLLWASSCPVYERGSYSNSPPFGDVIEVEILEQ